MCRSGFVLGLASIRTVSAMSGRVMMESHISAPTASEEFLASAQSVLEMTHPHPIYHYLGNVETLGEGLGVDRTVVVVFVPPRSVSATSNAMWSPLLTLFSTAASVLIRLSLGMLSSNIGKLLSP